MSLTQVTTGGVDENINIDSNTLKVDGTNNRVGVGTDAPGALLDVKASSSRQIRVATESSNNAGLVQCTDSSGNNRDIALGGQNITFCTGAFDSTSRSEVGRFDTSGNFGIGTASADEPLHIKASDPAIKLEDSDGTNQYSVIKNAAGNSIYDAVNGSGTAGAHIFRAPEGSSNEKMRLDTSGRLLVGTSSSRSVGGNITGKLQIEGTGTGASTTACTVTQNSNDATGGRLMLAKSRGTSNGSVTLVQDGDTLGMIDFAGADGTNAGSSAIRIIGQVDGTPGADDMPGRLVFQVAADGASSPTERMRIDSLGRVGIGSPSPNATFEVAATGTCSVNLVADSDNNGSNNDALISFHTDSNSGTANATIKYDQSESNLGIDTNGSRRLSIDSSGRLLSGVTSAEDSNSTLEIIRNSGQNHVRCQSNSLANGQYSMFRAFGNTSGGGSRQAYLGVYKHSGIVNPGAFMLLEQEDGGNSYYWTDNSGKLRTSTANSNIGTTGGTVVGSQSSDLRLKNVGANVSYGLAEVKQLQPKQYALKTDPDVNCLGFIAQEVESVIPEAVFDTKEELDGHQEGDRTKLGMEYVQLIPVLVNAIKELSAEVDTLKTKVAALEAAA